MSWKEFFGLGDKERDEVSNESLTHLTLSNLQAGWIVDFDLKTWEVTAYNFYDWGHGDLTHEWQLKTHDDLIYLEKESDDEAEWCISRPVPFQRLGPELPKYIAEHEDPPDEIRFDGELYRLDSFGGGYFCKDGKEPGQEFLAWDYVDASGEKYLSVEQWGDTEFESFIGSPVEEYRFTNILPREKK